MTSLAGVRVVVTGAAQGMGLAHCRYFAKEGARVAALDIDTAQLERSRRELAEEGLEILTLNCDVARRADVERAIEEVGSRLGGIDAIVSNAGTIHTVQGLEDTDDDDWDRTLAVHVGGARNLCRASLPWLRRSEHPRIVIISSMWAQRGGGFGYAYCAAKGALLAFSRNNAIAPGSVPTRMAADYGPDEIAEDCKSIPMGRWAEAEEISKLVGFLSSSDASYLTGQTIAINGGQIIAGF
jgi:NAD(P)-dependent dehydrogenase (short-subunit alcohol dehydrogenase family)